MGAKEVLGRAGNAVLGNADKAFNIQKALLVIHNTHRNTLNDPANTVDQQNAANRNAMMNTLLALYTGTSSPNAQFGIRDERLLDKVLKDASTDTWKPYVFEVQYNPRKLGIKAVADTIPILKLAHDEKKKIPSQTMRPPSVILELELILNAVNPTDSFMRDKMRVSTGDFFLHQLPAFKKKKSNERYSIQPQTEAMLALLLRKETQLVTFRWADMSFTGEVVEARADHDMFSPTGSPVHTVLQMYILQNLEEFADGDYWNSAIDRYWENVMKDLKAKDGANDNVNDFVKIDQKVGNILNLGSFK